MDLEKIMLALSSAVREVGVGEWTMTRVGDQFAAENECFGCGEWVKVKVDGDACIVGNRKCEMSPGNCLKTQVEVELRRSGIKMVK